MAPRDPRVNGDAWRCMAMHGGAWSENDRTEVGEERQGSGQGHPEKQNGGPCSGQWEVVVDRWECPASALPATERVAAICWARQSHPRTGRWPLKGHNETIWRRGMSIGESRRSIYLLSRPGCRRSAAWIDLEAGRVSLVP
jgi:hypothetical protein